MKAHYAEERNGAAGFDETGADCPLTGQEKRVLLLVAKAQSNKEIAVSLKISPSTVKRHLENILRKLSLKNRVEAAIYALGMGRCPLGNKLSHCPMLVQQIGWQENSPVGPLDSENKNVLASRQ